MAGSARRLTSVAEGSSVRPMTNFSASSWSANEQMKSPSKVDSKLHALDGLDFDWEYPTGCVDPDDPAQALGCGLADAAVPAARPPDPQLATH